MSTEGKSLTLQKLKELASMGTIALPETLQMAFSFLIERLLEPDDFNGSLKLDKIKALTVLIGVIRSSRTVLSSD